MVDFKNISVYILFSTLIFLFVYWRIKNRRYYQLLAKIPGVKWTLPLIGNVHQIGSNSEEFLFNIKYYHEQAGKSTFKFMIGVEPLVILSEPETVAAILGSNTEIVKSHEYTLFQEWLGDGLLLSKGDKWRKQRKIITTAFHFKILEQFIDVFNDKGNVLIEKLKQNTGMILNIYPFVTLYALDVITESAMGVNINAQRNPSSEYVKAVYRICELLYDRVHSLKGRFNFLYKLTKDYRDLLKNLNIIHTFSAKIINSRKNKLNDANGLNESNLNGKAATMNSNGHPKHEKLNGHGEKSGTIDENSLGIKGKLAFLDLLLACKMDDGNPLPEQVIKEEVDTFMFEGHDTVSSLISFAIYSLSNSPSVQQKAFEELISILGDDHTASITLKDLNDMKYLELVIKETLRLYPSVPYYGRKLINDLVLPDGRVIPANAGIVISAIAQGRNEKFFKDPESFIPERFLPENTFYRHPYRDIGFSAGPRNCIGQRFAMLEVKSVLSKIIRNFELHPGGPGSELRLIPEVTLKSKNGVIVQLKQRKYNQ